MTATTPAIENLAEQYMRVLTSATQSTRGFWNWPGKSPELCRCDDMLVNLMAAFDTCFDDPERLLRLAPERFERFVAGSVTMMGKLATDLRSAPELQPAKGITLDRDIAKLLSQAMEQNLIAKAQIAPASGYLAC